MSAVAESLRKIATKTEKVSKKSKKSIGGDEEAGDEEKKEKKDKKDKKRSKEVADAADEVVEGRLAGPEYRPRGPPCRHRPSRRRCGWCASR